MDHFNEAFHDFTEIRDSRFNFNIRCTEIVSANIIEVKAGTNGFCGGDSGHGSRTYFSIADLGSTDITVNQLKVGRCGNVGFEVILGGDCELSTIIEALKFITETLEEKAYF